MTLREADEVDVVELYPHSMKERARVSLGGNSAPGVRGPVGAVVDRRLPVLPGGRQAARVDARLQAKAGRKVSVRYITEDEMEALAYNASLQKGFEPSQAMMLAACTRNIYAIGTGYHPTTVTMIEEVCKEQAKEGAAWAVLMLELLAGRMPRLRSEKTAAARSAAAARKRKRRKAP